MMIRTCRKGGSRPRDDQEGEGKGQGGTEVRKHLNTNVRGGLKTVGGGKKGDAGELL